MARLTSSSSSEGGRRRPSFKGRGGGHRRRASHHHDQDDEQPPTKSVREVIRLFEAAHAGAKVVMVRKKDSLPTSNDRLILVRRSGSRGPRVKPALVPKPAKLSLPKDHSILDSALEGPPRENTLYKLLGSKKTKEITVVKDKDNEGEVDSRVSGKEDEKGVETMEVDKAEEVKEKDTKRNPEEPTVKKSTLYKLLEKNRPPIPVKPVINRSEVQKTTPTEITKNPPYETSSGEDVVDQVRYTSLHDIHRRLVLRQTSKDASSQTSVEKSDGVYSKDEDGRDEGGQNSVKSNTHPLFIRADSSSNESIPHQHSLIIQQESLSKETQVKIEPPDLESHIQKELPRIESQIYQELPSMEFSIQQKSLITDCSNEHDSPSNNYPSILKEAPSHSDTQPYIPDSLIQLESSTTQLGSSTNPHVEQDSLMSNTITQQDPTLHQSTLRDPAVIPKQVDRSSPLFDDYETFQNYEDVAYSDNSYAVIEEKEEAIYDDVVNLRSEGVYEIVYTSQSHHGSDESVDQRNSIYEARPPSETSLGSSGPGGSGTSDDWVDVEEEVNNEKVKRERVVICSLLDNEVKNTYPQRHSPYSNTREGVSEENETAHYESVQIVDEDSAVCDDFSDDSDDESLSSGKTTPSQPHIINGVNNGTTQHTESIYCLIREAGKKTWSKSLQLFSKISSNGEDKPNSGWLTLNKKNKRRHSVKSMSTFYIAKETLEPNDRPPVPPIDPRRHSMYLEGSRMSIALRPTSPPPPPPPRVNGNSQKVSDTMRELVESSYQIGFLSMNGGGPAYYSDLDNPRSDTSSEHGSSQGSDINLRFADEPLYQFYEANVFEREKAELEVDEVNYEELDSAYESRPSALDLVTTQLNRTLWCQVPQVISSGILERLTQAEKQLQEAKFELMTSEASYYKSLTVLEKHFAHSSLLKDPTILPKVDYKTLFSNVAPVRKCSELVLGCLDKCWQEDILLDGICQVVFQLASSQFHTYVKYCTNQVSIEKTIKKLKASNNGFLSALSTLESSPMCHSLTLSSFLLLPMQRITRMPLLLDAILTKLPPNHKEYQPCKNALSLLNKIVHDCNEAARQTERYEELATLSRALVFPSPLKPLLLLSASRWLVRSGVVTNISLEPKLTLTKKLTSKNTKLTMFLFTDYLVITKRKSDDCYSVIDYCVRNLVQMSRIDEQLSSGKFLVMLTMLENHEKKTQEMVICCGSESSRERWLSAVTPPSSDKEGEVLYEDWDCPQVTVIHTFTPTQPDELTLRVGDVINVLRKLSDGWYYGEKMRGRESGWFPGNHTMEIASAHVRARNLKQRYRLLALSNTYIQEQLGKKN